jgi:hypothetical protein
MGLTKSNFVNWSDESGSATDFRKQLRPKNQPATLRPTREDCYETWTISFNPKPTWGPPKEADFQPQS